MATMLGEEAQSETLCDSEMSSEYEFVPTPAESIAEERELAFRPKEAFEHQPSVRVTVHEAAEKDGILISVKPPKVPAQLKHTPCDIVLTIDVSGSMSAEAPPPAINPNETEHNGLTVLDLVKHAARTIVETLDDTDRLALVTFSTEAKIIQRLLPMTPDNKARTLRNINHLRPESMTNLWHGLMESIRVFECDERSNCVPAIMVLTDGLPNHMCPPQGYVKKLRTYRLPARLHTFGFGFSLRSGLMKSLSEIGGGNYAFIPDSGMLGTVFIHAVANLQSTFATQVTLTVETPESVRLSKAMGVEATRGPVTSGGRFDLEYESSKEIASGGARTNTLIIELDDVLYGQSRDIFLKYQERPSGIETQSITYRLTGRPINGSLLDISETASFEVIAPETITYHRYRAEICELINWMFPLNCIEEHQTTDDAPLTELCAKVDALASRIQVQAGNDGSMLSLIEDLVGKEPNGQIRLAVSNIDYFEKWGKHYLLSILCAHQKQVCNSFKDSGPLLYGSESPLFIQCRDALDKAFDHLPPPKPSRPPRFKTGHQSSVVDMRRYHNRENPCFTGECRVLSEGGHQIPIQSLRLGMKVQTLKGFAKVAAVIATKVNAAPVCIIGCLRITPWHPIRTATEWTFPAKLADKCELFDGYVYSVLLERNGDASGHTIQVEGQWATTLGHGITTGADVRAHEFFGDYDKVVQSLDSLPADSDGVRQCGGIRRNRTTGLASGLLPVSERAWANKLNPNCGSTWLASV
ncbi:uncharacterized protein PV09_03972 [Verruconis gallopava]|uniref:VWFA domain-containing protein n=1 Tax=Verruconis gallopava TaxID=253628 RepID=A0A0D2B083_9PEZI|nr:uncharacterized protein PV09_03972 [Verruconis gallopava]KIW04784.1 hypothetical protein PV09_03972 [Verruconis gallopava]